MNMRESAARSIRIVIRTGILPLAAAISPISVSQAVATGARAADHYSAVINPPATAVHFSHGY